MSPADTTDDNPRLPTFDELPVYKDIPGCAWDVFGPRDQLGTVNLLTPPRVKSAAHKEIKTGSTFSLNWPINFPAKPAFKRKSPEILTKLNPRGTRDEEIHINTQSGTQWDGMKHFGLIQYGMHYGGSTNDDLWSEGLMPSLSSTDDKIGHLGIQNWANHGICGRGVLLDLVSFYSNKNEGALPYDPWATHPIPLADILECASHQGVEFQIGDILLLRVGFMKKWNNTSEDEKDALGDKPETFAGLEQTDDMKRFLWDNHFGAIASDQPALERWPIPEGVSPLHSTILGLWGMPLGEFFYLEDLAAELKRQARSTFFFSSWPLNIIGGCASPPNAAAYL